MSEVSEEFPLKERISAKMVWEIPIVLFLGNLT